MDERQLRGLLQLMMKNVKTAASKVTISLIV